MICKIINNKIIIIQESLAKVLTGLFCLLFTGIILLSFLSYFMHIHFSLSLTVTLPWKVREWIWIFILTLFEVWGDFVFKSWLQLFFYEWPCLSYLTTPVLKFLLYHMSRISESTSGGKINKVILNRILSIVHGKNKSSVSVSCWHYYYTCCHFITTIQSLYKLSYW